MLWVYFFLIIFEGALRKWFLPNLSDLLLVVRDPVGIAILYIAFINRLLKPNIYFKGLFFIGIFGFFIAMFGGHENIFVALFGIRVFLIHMPLIFVIGKVFVRKDVIAIGKAMLYFSILMAVLIIFQFYSSQSSYINCGVGGNMDGTSGIGGALDFYRPSGTFSYANGNSLFWGLLAPFVFYFWINLSYVNKFVLIFATASLLVSIYFSISRTVLFEISLSFVFVIFISLRSVKLFNKVIVLILVISLLIIVFSQLEIFQTGKLVFITRIFSANETEGSIIRGTIYNRFVDKGLLQAFSIDHEISFVGDGIGSNSNFAAKLLGVKSGISDFEWPRLILELGLILGMLTICLRIGIAVHVIKKYFTVNLKDNKLPILLMSFGILQIIQGQFAQPTSLGFISMSGGLIIASFNQNKYKGNKILKNENTISTPTNATFL